MNTALTPKEAEIRDLFVEAEKLKLSLRQTNRLIYRKTGFAAGDDRLTELKNRLMKARRN